MKTIGSKHHDRKELGDLDDCLTQSDSLDWIYKYYPHLKENAAAVVAAAEGAARVVKRNAPV